MMRRSLIVVTRPGDGVGFRLAGARVEEVAPGEEEARLEPLFRDAGVLAVEEAVPVPDALRDRAARAGIPVLFPFTLPRHLGAGSTAESYVGMLIRRAIGYHVRLK